MVISIHEIDSFEYKLIPLFINRDNDQLDPCFAAFKRIDCIKTDSKNFKLFIANLQLIGKASVRIDDLIINKQDISKMSEFYKDKEVNFMLHRLKIDNCDFDYISDEEAKFINKINPKMFKIERIKRNFENIKTLFLLNCTEIDEYIYYSTKNFINLCFIKTPIQLFDSQFDQRLTFK